MKRIWEEEGEWAFLWVLESVFLESLRTWEHPLLWGNLEKIRKGYKLFMYINALFLLVCLFFTPDVHWIFSEFECFHSCLVLFFMMINADFLNWFTSNLAYM